MAFKAFDLTGKAALVTGGNSGIGFGMAEGLAQAGADVAIWGTNPEKNAEAEAKLKEYGGKVLGQLVDVANPGAVARGMAQAIAHFGRLDTVVANAGVGGNGAKAFHELEPEAWRKVMSVNLDGVFFTLQEACKHMAARAEAGDPGGSLILISSTSAVHGAARNEAYGSSKTAVLGLMRGLAVEYARYGVRVNAILPGWTRSGITEPLQGNEKFTAQVIGRVPQRRWGDPSEFGGIAVYLASDAASFHTGDSIVIDGGYTIF